MYAACEICATSSKIITEISYSDLTYISICSGKNDSNTTYSLGHDIGHVLEFEQFQSVAKICNEVKPIAMIFADGGPDENPRFPKTLDMSIQNFKTHKFDVLLIYPCSKYVRQQSRGKINGTTKQGFGWINTFL